MDFDALVSINRAVVGLTGEPHEYAEADRRKLASLIHEVEERGDNLDFDEAVREKASLLVFKIASGQYFRAGNKRTALVAGLAFLVKNGRTIDIRNTEFVSTVDRAGIAAASLDDVYGVIERLQTKSKTERRGWDGVVRTLVEANGEFLARLSAQAAREPRS
jgi:prophage maintenance system killer protein